MPTTRQRRRPRRRGAYSTSERVLIFLCIGLDYAFLDPDLGDELDEQLCRNTWKALRQEITAKHAAERSAWEPKQPWAAQHFDGTPCGWTY